MKTKFKGKLVVTLELLGELLNLQEGENITHVRMTADDIQRDTVTLIIQSNANTDNVVELAEGQLLPTNVYTNSHKNMWEVLKGKLLEDSINFRTGESDKSTYSVREMLDMIKQIENNN